MDATTVTPHEVLGLSRGATPDEVRQAYLELVRAFPPDREPDRFHQIHAAYQLLCDPLEQASAWVRPIRGSVDLQEVIAAADSRRPRIPKLVLLALGNEA